MSPEIQEIYAAIDRYKKNLLAEITKEKLEALGWHRSRISLFFKRGSKLTIEKLLKTRTEIESHERKTNSQ